MRLVVPPEPRLVLASASPNRLAVLADCGVTPTVMAADIDEQPHKAESAVELTRRLAAAKCKAILGRLAEESPGAVVIAADTVVSCEGTIFGKANSRTEAASTLRQLSGASHQVVTGLAVGCCEIISVEHVTTEVTFSKLSAARIDAYLNTGEYEGKAGAYGIQGVASLFVEHIEGSYHNVVGLPTHALELLLSGFGRSLFDWQCS